MPTATLGVIAGLEQIHAPLECKQLSGSKAEKAASRWTWPHFTDLQWLIWSAKRLYIKSNTDTRSTGITWLTHLIASQWRLLWASWDTCQPGVLPRLLKSTTWQNMLDWLWSLLLCLLSFALRRHAVYTTFVSILHLCFTFNQLCKLMDYDRWLCHKKVFWRNLKQKKKLDWKELCQIMNIFLFQVIIVYTQIII